MKRDDLDFGEDMVRRGVLTQQQFDDAVALAQNKRQGLRKSLSDLKLFSGGELDQQRAVYYGIPFMDLDTFSPEPQMLMLIREEFARVERVFPLFATPSSIAIAISDPTNLVTIDQVRSDTNLEVELYYAPADAIERAIDRNYSHSIFASLDTPADGGAAPGFDVPKLVNSLLSQAVRGGASDIHIEPGSEAVLIRQRVDGILQEVHTLPKTLQANVISRIKILAELDISETRVPQDGQIQTQIAGEEVSLRVSTLPTLNGENVVIRLLISSKARLGLINLGFSESDYQRFTESVQRPHGMVIVTGPTGSGKTTTLYAALELLNTIKKNIMTIEDPVEYTVELLRQVQVNAKTGLDFAAGLRSILRQDPDVVMVGEIRDTETATVAVQAALTGHLLLSTLHTNDAASAVTRLQQMGVPNYLVASSLNGVLAQRLVRRLCADCRQTYEPPPRIRQLHPNNSTWYQAAGCDACKHTGYRGRTGVYEFLAMSPEVQEAILEAASASRYRDLARSQGMTTMFEDGLRKLAEGVTTIDELLAVTEALAHNRSHKREASPSPAQPTPMIGE